MTSRAVRVPATQGTFGRLLRAMRIARKNNPVHIGHRVSISPRFYGVIESGNKFPALPVFARLWRVMGGDAHEVLAAVQGANSSPTGDDGAIAIPADPMLATLADPASAGPFDNFGDYIQMARIKRAMRPIEAIQKLGYDPVRYERIELGLELPSFVLAVHMYRVLRFDITQALLPLWHIDALNKLDVAGPYEHDGSDDVAHPAPGETR